MRELCSYLRRVAVLPVSVLMVLGWEYLLVDACCLNAANPTSEYTNQRKLNRLHKTQHKYAHAKQLQMREFLAPPTSQPQEFDLSAQFCTRSGSEMDYSSTCLPNHHPYSSTNHEPRTTSQKPQNNFGNSYTIKRSNNNDPEHVEVCKSARQFHHVCKDEFRAIRISVTSLSALKTALGAQASQRLLEYEF
ncbi:hypothetical protein BDZ45DRAFT_735156 [Acephala macrosclerotiorum]|nr:hypothetical protein BDZ45DRAFT_735156 [Acephala macrosclerotiorum]